MVLKRSRNTLVAAAGAGEWNVQFYVEERQMGQWSCVSTRFMYRWASNPQIRIEKQLWFGGGGIQSEIS